LEFHSPAPASSLEKPVGIVTRPPPRTKKWANRIRGRGQIGPSYGLAKRGLMLPPCKQALGMWLRGPWRMDMQLLFKSALIRDYRMCMIWTWGGKGKKLK